MDRSSGVTVIAVVSLLGSIILLYCGMSEVGALASLSLPVSDPRMAHFLQTMQRELESVSRPQRQSVP